jgi:hypothetical protein
MRTSTCLYGSYFRFGTSSGSKSGGKYRFNTLRSPIFYYVARRGGVELRRWRLSPKQRGGRLGWRRAAALNWAWPLLLESAF